MKNYHRLTGLIFNTPQMVREDMLDMAVHWANQALNLNVINVGAPVIGAFHEESSQVEVQQASPAERRLLAAQSTGVYMMPVHGVLVSRSAHLDMCQTMTSYEGIREMLRAAVNDPAVAHIVMDIDTPGGSSTGCFELCDEIRAARTIKPITAISNFGAYSAGYAIASSASQVIVSQSSGVGSIGVIARHLDMSKRHEQQGVKITSVYAGARKNDLSSEAPMSDEALQWLTGLVNRQYDAFTQLVSINRALDIAAVRATEAGVYFGEEAVAAGLADRVETPQAAVDRIAAEVAASRANQGARRIAAQAAAMNVQNCM
ncbi:S49 family peptidase [Kerstersia gyiorum]|uniref:S49 family peptidase n=1 Tax=Kerstersia gyiorum TaxID=206506 RepID=UPI001070D6A7|nr:S49 family peptidase [Kerstersia gyiorum]QBR40959.1 S49 family peptidase [Kerstersia gyiorum]